VLTAQTSIERVVMPFKKGNRYRYRQGVSGNLAGVSKEKAQLKGLYEKVLSEVVDSSEANPDKLTNFERVIREELQLALTATSDRLRAEACGRIRTQVLGRDYDLTVSNPENLKVIFERRNSLDVAELLKDSGLTKAQIKALRKKALAMQHPGRGFDQGGDG